MPSRLLSRLPAALLGGLLLLPAGAWAADGEDAKLNLKATGDSAGTASSGGGGGALVRTIVGLVVVLAIIYALTWVLKQVKSSREAGAAGNGLATLSTLPLGSDRAVHLVRAGEEVVLIGSGPQGVTHLRTYTLDEARGLGIVDADDDVFDPPTGNGSGTGARGGSAAARRKLLDAVRERTVLR